MEWRGVPTWAFHEKAGNAFHRSSSRGVDIESGDGNQLIRLGDENASPSFALWGDSHALAFMPGLDAAAAERKKAGYFINVKNNFTMNRHIGTYDYRPREEREPVFRWLESRPDVEDVIIVSRWGANIWDPSDQAEIELICERLQHIGKRVFLAREVAANAKGVRCMSWLGWAPEYLLKLDDYTYQQAVNAAALEPVIKKLSERGIIQVLPINEAFYDEGYRMGTGTNSYFYDSSHLNSRGAVWAAAYVAPILWGPDGN